MGAFSASFVVASKGLCHSELNVNSVKIMIICLLV
jgi:hypothetical protein